MSTPDKVQRDLRLALARAGIPFADTVELGRDLGDWWWTFTNKGVVLRLSPNMPTWPKLECYTRGVIDGLRWQRQIQIQRHIRPAQEVAR